MGILVLKIIGITVLCILLCIVLLLLLILFAPFRYKVTMQGDTRFEQEETSFCASADVRYLLGLVHLMVRYDSKEGDLALKICGIKCYPRSLKSKNKAHKKAADTVTDTAPGTTYAPKTDAPPVADAPTGTDARGDDHASQDIPGTGDQDTHRDKKRDQKSKKSKAKNKPIRKRLQTVKEAFAKEENKNALAHVLAECKYLCGKILPKKVYGDAIFSMGSPDTTGMALGVCSWLPFIYDRRFALSADFLSEKGYLAGDCGISGFMQTYPVLLAAFRLFHDRDIRALWNQLRGGNRHGG